MKPTSPVAYLNGQFQPLDEVRISPLDRGFLYADGIYEMIPVYNGRCFRLTEHLQRLNGCLTAIRLDADMGQDQWEALISQLIAHNGGGDLAVYLQVTRGTAPNRDHGFPASVRPTVFAMANPLKPMPEAVRREGVAAIIRDDIRWGACHLKTIALLANVLARQEALDHGATETILVRECYLTEGAASNLFLVRDEVILTPRKDHRILPGITRDLVLELATANGVSYQEQDLPASALETADEVWFTSSTKEILPVTRIEDRPVGKGIPGPLWRYLMELYQAYKREVCPPVL